MTSTAAGPHPAPRSPTSLQSLESFHARIGPRRELLSIRSGQLAVEFNQRFSLSLSVSRCVRVLAHRCLAASSGPRVYTLGISARYFDRIGKYIPSQSVLSYSLSTYSQNVDRARTVANDGRVTRKRKKNRINRAGVAAREYCEYKSDGKNERRRGGELVVSCRVRSKV